MVSTHVDCNWSLLQAGHRRCVRYAVICSRSRLLLTKRMCTLPSVLIIIVWCTYCSKGMLKISGLIRAIVKEATVYFLVMVTTQVSNLVGVWALAFFPRCSAMAVCNHNKAAVNNFQFCECTVDSEGDSRALNRHIAWIVYGVYTVLFVHLILGNWYLPCHNPILTLQFAI